MNQAIQVLTITIPDTFSHFLCQYVPFFLVLGVFLEETGLSALEVVS